MQASWHVSFSSPAPPCSSPTLPLLCPALPLLTTLRNIFNAAAGTSTTERAQMDERLAAAVDQTRHLCDICGVPGIAVGVVHHGKVALIHCLGLRDVDKQLHMDCDTKLSWAVFQSPFLRLQLGSRRKRGKCASMIRCRNTCTTLIRQKTLALVFQRPPQILVIGPDLCLCSPKTTSSNLSMRFRHRISRGRRSLMLGTAPMRDTRCRCWRSRRYTTCATQPSSSNAFSSH
jgi:hypothetical protein